MWKVFFFSGKVALSQNLKSNLLQQIGRLGKKDAHTFLLSEISLHFSRCLPKTWNFRLMLLPSLRYLLCRSLYQQKKPLEVFCKKRCSKKSHQFQKKTPVWSLFLKELRAFRSAILLKRDSNTVVFLWNFQNF